VSNLGRKSSIVHTVIAKIVQSFVDEWSLNSDVLAILLTGSIVLGTSTSNSDIDIMVIVHKNSSRQRGNYLKDDCLVEYFIETEAHLHKQMDLDFANNQKTTARMITTGQMVYIDSSFSFDSTLRYAQEYFSKPFLSLTPEQIEDRKYWLWDSLDGVSDAFKSNSPAKNFVSFLHISLVLQLYCNFSQLEIPHMAKAYKLSSDPSFRNKYQFPALGDTFTDKLLTCLVDKPALAAIHDLTIYVLQVMGGFDITNWKTSYHD